MKKFLLMLSLVGAFTFASAQDEKEYTDEELTTYANVMVWAGVQKKEMTGIYNGWIKSDDVLSVKRFKEIDKTKGDSLKLAELGISENEKAAYDKIMFNQDSMTSSFITVYKAKIKEEIGNGNYNSLRKAMKADADLKARYQAIFDKLKEEAATKEDESED